MYNYDDSNAVTMTKTAKESAILAEIKKVQGTISDYNAFASKLRSIKTTIENVKTNYIEQAKKALEAGFYDESGTLDRGKLTNLKESMDDVCKSILALINKCYSYQQNVLKVREARLSEIISIFDHDVKAVVYYDDGETNVGFVQKVYK